MKKIKVKATMNHCSESLCVHTDEHAETTIVDEDRLAKYVSEMMCNALANALDFIEAQVPESKQNIRPKT